MVFSEDENQNENLLEKHFEKINEVGVKKYVISIDNKYSHIVDKMSIDERNELINDIISLHCDNVNEKKQAKKFVQTLFKIFIFFLILLFAAPGLLWLINKSFTLTKNNYTEMQTNFEILYENKTK